MKKLFVVALALCLLAPLSTATENDVAPNLGTVSTLSSGPSLNALGDLLWSLDVTTPTGDIRCLGVEFDGTNFWVTGAYDMTIAYLWEISPGGAVVNQYLQPAANWGGWGWRDLAWDGKYLYAGDPNAGNIVQIDPTNGTPTGVQYGTFPVVPCRALAYDSDTDSFWTASFSSSIYQCFKDGTYNVFTNPGVTFYGAAYVEFDGMWWAWSQDGIGCLATEFDPGTGTPTGRTFDGDAGIGGIAGGACAYDAGGGAWELCGLSQTTNDTIAGYDLDTSVVPFKVSPTMIESWVGGTLNFSLNAGTANAGRYYAIFGGLTGSAPGFNLPGGGANVPVNWDGFTNILLSAGLPGFIGPLDGSGTAAVSLYIPHHTPPFDYTMTFAYGLAGPPWDFASNAVDVDVKMFVNPGYVYDDGSGENLLGWTSGGEIAFMHAFDSGPGDVINKVSNVYGSTVYPGYGPGNGTVTAVYIWDDPTNNNMPDDCVCLDKVDTMIQNEDTDIFNDTSLSGPTNVTGVFFVGCMVPHTAGMFVCPLDMDTIVPGVVWYAGNFGAGAFFDYKNIMNNTYGEYTTGVWLLRAIP